MNRDQKIFYSSLIVPAAVFILIFSAQSGFLSDNTKKVLDCSNRGEDCSQVEIDHTVRECDVWRPYMGIEELNCVETAEGLEKVSLITDSANHVRSEIYNSSVSVDIKNFKELESPWDIEFTKNGSYFITYRNGSLVRYSRRDEPVQSDNLDVFYNRPDTFGLLGMALDPKFEENRYIYLYYTYGINRELVNSFEGTDNGGFKESSYNLNRVSRFEWRNGELRNEKILIDEIPGGRYHNGGRLEIGPEGKLYVTAGDAGYPEGAQNISFLGGKILRVNRNGTIPKNNPFQDSPVYAFGIKNPQGLAWSPKGQLYSDDHGGWREDELNRIVKGENYGWPKKTCKGEHSREEIKKKFIEGAYARDANEISLRGAGRESVWCISKWTMAPSGMTFVNDTSSPWHGDLFVAGLRGKHLHRFNFEEDKLVDDGVFYVNRENEEEMSRRIREVEYFNGSLWIAGDEKGIAELSSEQKR